MNGVNELRGLNFSSKWRPFRINHHLSEKLRWFSSFEHFGALKKTDKLERAITSGLLLLAIPFIKLHNNCLETLNSHRTIRVKSKTRKS